MDLLHLVDRLEELVASAQKMPIGSRAIVDRRRLLDIVDQMRIAVPREVREAQDMMVRRDVLEREAEEEARMIVVRAEQDAARLAEDHAITEAARRRAEEIVESAEQRLQERIDEANREIQDRLWESRGLAEQQMAAADAYAKELLERLERQLQAFVRSVHAGIEQLEVTETPEPPRASPEFEQAVNDQRGAGSTSAFSDRDDGPRDSGGWERRADLDPQQSRVFPDDIDELDDPRDPDDPADDLPESRNRLEPHDELRDGRPPGQVADWQPVQAAAQPVPLRPVPTSRTPLDLENLLFRDDEPPPSRTLRDAPQPPEAAASGVIDDFDLPGLDDDPTQRRPQRDN